MIVATFSSMKNDLLLQYILPSDLITHFDIVGVDQTGNQLTISLDEKNIIPLELQQGKVESKGFSDAVHVNDFPIRDKQVILCIRTRRWRDKETGESYSNSFKLKHQGTGLTKEFALFLKKNIRL